MPRAASQEAPRGWPFFPSCYRALVEILCRCLSLLNRAAHVDAAPPLIRPFWYRLFSFGMIAVLVVGIVAAVGGVAWKQKQERNKKRFF